MVPTAQASSALFRVPLESPLPSMDKQSPPVTSFLAFSMVCPGFPVTPLRALDTRIPRDGSGGTVSLRHGALAAAWAGPL